MSAIAGSFSYLAHALSLELAPSRVNVVSPGWVDTPMFNELAGDAKHGLFESMAARRPAGKIATPADVAPAYIHLMESDFTTGQTLRIDEPDLAAAFFRLCEQRTRGIKTVILMRRHDR